jgi:hypothetical protein
MENAARVAYESQIAVQVLLSRGNDDIELIPIRPRPLDGYMTPEDFMARQLRSVGVIGLSGSKPRCAFKEPLETPVVEAVGAAFLEYLRVLLGESFAEQMEVAEVAELERVYMLQDARPN